MSATIPPSSSAERHSTSAPTTPRPAAGPVRGRAAERAVGALVAATVAIAAAYAGAFAPGGAPAWSAWLMAVGVPLALVGIMTLGAARRGSVPRALLAAFALVGALLVAGFALALALPGGPSAGAGQASAAAEPLLLGLPRRAAVVVFGIGLLPVFVLPVAYALTFDAQTLRDEDLERVRAAGRAAADARRGAKGTR